MNIVLNEYDWAEEAIRKQELGKHPIETLSRIAKYYLYNGICKKDVRSRLEVFLKTCDPNIILSKWQKSIDNIMRYAEKYPLVILDHICVSESELAVICTLKGRQLQRTAFTLLCLAKYYYTVNPITDYWVSTPDNEVMSMANIHTSVKRQNLLYNKLNELGLISFSKKIDNLSIHVLFADDGEAALCINDFRNLGYQYSLYRGEPYFKCKCCGITTPIKSPGVGSRPKYCPECAIKIHTKQKIDSVMRHRDATRAKSVDNNIVA